ncbi:hypothetical protein SAMN05216368_101434 [Cryobacterium flavum]|uniref:Uncharacterized protein n=2 Tax=Microbacteriaceae TaxID=85023 RepID=A0A5E9FVC9_9MICO|nr:hypothetical protein SAMN05216368_101434 [Cryobacterium flavum]
MAVLPNGTGLFPTRDPYEYVLAIPQLDGLEADR